MIREGWLVGSLFDGLLSSTAKNDNFCSAGAAWGFKLGTNDWCFIAPICVGHDKSIGAVCTAIGDTP